MKKVILLSALALLLVTVISSALAIMPAQAVANYPTGFSEVQVAGGLNQPIGMEFAPDGRMFVTEKGGAVRIIKDGNLLPVAFATLAVDSSVERGLNGITLDPDFATNGYVYVHYMTPTNPIYGRVSRLTASPSNPNVMQAGSELVLIDRIPSDSGIHDAGEIKFGPDGKLYIPTGDAGFATARYSQEMFNLAGKVLRINKDGTIPSDNPYTGVAGVRPEIYASGLRNPFSMAVDPTTGKIFMNDVGYNNVEEINELSRGANYGWPNCEGRCDNPAYTNPVYQYDHNFGRSITGGAFYYGNAYPAEYNGTYFFSDYSTSFIKNLDFKRSGTVTNFGNDVNFPVNLKTGPDGLLYYASIFSGSINKIQYRPQIPPAPSGDGNGLYGTYFNNKTFAGAPTLARVDPTVNFDFQGGSPAAGVNADQFSARWTGQIQAQYSEPYTFSFNGDDGYRVYINDRLVINKYVDQPATTTSGTFDMIAGQKYDIKIEFFESYGNAVAQLYWNSPSQQRQIIPTTQLYARAPGQAPEATITSPSADGASFRGGKQINYAGSAIDPEDGQLPASALTWDVILHHDVHTHPFLGPIKGVANGNFTIPVNSEASANSYYELKLTATDSTGQTTTTSRNILPESSRITYTSNITGAKLQLDSQPVTAPHNEQNVVGIERSLSAPATQVIDGKTYNFVGWSDDGAAAHKIYVPETATTYTANYELAPVGTPNPQATTVKIYAAGLPAAGIYPNAELLVNDIVVKRFDSIRGNPDTRQFVEYNYDSPTAVTAEQIKIRYINDDYLPPEDRNLRVDKIVIGQTTYETEAPGVYSTGTWANDTGCAAGNKKSEWLQCGGYFSYGAGGTTTPPPAPSPEPTGSTLKIYAAGTSAAGVFPTLDVLVNQASIRVINDIRGNPGARQFTEYTITTANRITISQLRLMFANDAFIGGEDRNVRIDKVVLDGTTYEVEAPSSYSTGTWSSVNGCAAGNKQSEWLQCSGYISFQ